MWHWHPSLISRLTRVPSLDADRQELEWFPTQNVTSEGTWMQHHAASCSEINLNFCSLQRRRNSASHRFLGVCQDCLQLMRLSNQNPTVSA